MIFLSAVQGSCSLGPTSEVKVGKSVYLWHISIYGALNRYKTYWILVSSNIFNRREGFRGLYFNPKSLRQLQRRKPFSQKLFNGFKRRRTSRRRDLQRAKKKEKNVCKTWYNDLGNSNVFLPQVYRQKIVQNYRRENGKSW